MKKNEFQRSHLSFSAQCEGWIWNGPEKALAPAADPGVLAEKAGDVLIAHFKRIAKEVGWRAS